MYSILPNLVLAFHGCDEDTYQKVLYNHENLLPSNNTYDWLGNTKHKLGNSLKKQGISDIFIRYALFFIEI